MNSTINTGFWLSRTGLVLLGFIGIAGFFLFTEHRAHVLGALPYILLLLCPLLHFLGHGDHGGHKGAAAKDEGHGHGEPRGGT